MWSEAGWVQDGTEKRDDMRAAALAASLQNECDGRVWRSSKKNSNVLDLCNQTQLSESTTFFAVQL